MTGMEYINDDCAPRAAPSTMDRILMVENQLKTNVRESKNFGCVQHAFLIPQTDSNDYEPTNQPREVFASVPSHQIVYQLVLHRLYVSDSHSVAAGVANNNCVPFDIEAPS